MRGALGSRSFTVFKDKTVDYRIKSNLDIDKVLKIMESFLSHEDKEIFFLVFIEGYKYAEVAKKLKISQGTVGSRINRNLKKIKQELDKKNVFRSRKLKNEN